MAGNSAKYTFAFHNMDYGIYSCRCNNFTFHGITYPILTNTLENILGYIESSKGKNGGIYLAKHMEKISLQELIIKLEPNFNLVECSKQENNTCQILPTCVFKGILHVMLYYY